MPTDKLGEFELLVLLAILHRRDEAYANQVRDELQARGNRKVTRGALYRTLDRLTDKGFVSWEMVPSDVPERGGHPMRKLSVTDEGLEAVRRSRDVILGFLDGLGSLLDPR